MLADSADTQKNYPAGTIIMHQGDAGDCAYIIEKGSVEIYLENADGTIQPFGTRGPGAMIGEMSLIDQGPRSATIRAVEDCTLLQITAEDFSRRLDNADPILRMATDVILTRYRDTLARSIIMKEAHGWPPAEAIELKHSQKTDAIESIKIANEFQTALDTGQISLHYQPIINLQTGYIAGFEALMRWEHPEKGMISPAVFIPVIEESGHIIQASKWALREALLALKRIEQNTGLHDDLFMSINFSSYDFASEDFVDSVYSTISESDVDASQVHLEITERLLMGQPDTAKETLNMCRKAGMEISIDDFGTGYSSLSYLHHFPIDILKIDQSFIRNMLEEKGVMELVKSINSLGKNMNMHIIAEGIESEKEASALREIDCDMGQGYFFSKPLPEVEILPLVNRWKKFEF